jgi:hypothetical protein
VPGAGANGRGDDMRQSMPHGGQPSPVAAVVVLAAFLSYVVLGALRMPAMG